MIVPHYTSLKTLIETRLNNVKTVDWFNNQYERYKDLKAVAFPAYYIEFPVEIDWTQMGNNVQQADVDIVIHSVVFDVKDSPVSILNIGSDVFKKLNKQVLWNGTDQLSTELIRKRSGLVTNYDQLKVVKTVFTTNIIDISGKADSVEVTPNYIIQ